MLLVTIEEIKSFLLKTSPTIKQGHAKEEQRGGIASCSPSAPDVSGATPVLMGECSGQLKGWRKRWVPTGASSIEHSTNTTLGVAALGSKRYPRNGYVAKKRSKLQRTEATQDPVADSEIQSCFQQSG